MTTVNSDEHDGPPILAPDEIIDQIILDLSFCDDQGSSLEDIWRFTSQIVTNVDSTYKSILWQWLLSFHQDLDILIKGVKQPSESINQYQDFNYVQSLGDDLRISCTEEVRWIRLTGKPRQGNSIGQFPFELLRLVAKSRAQGQTSIELAKTSGQDPRSVSGRINLLVDLGLVDKFPIVGKGFNTNRVVLKKFIETYSRNTNLQGSVTANANRDEIDIDLPHLYRSIVEALKTAKNGIRHHYDLKRELGLDSDVYKRKIFSAAVRKLEAQGHLKRITVYLQGDEKARYRCIKFIKDLPEKYNDVDSDEDSLDEAEIEDLQQTGNDSILRNGEDDDDNMPSSGMDLDDSSRIIKVEDDGISTTHEVRFNLFYPIENQIFEIIDSSKTSGITSSELSSKVGGLSYQRSISKFLDSMVEPMPNNSSKSKVKKTSQSLSPVTLEHLQIIRGRDSSARMQFYRYFSRISFTIFRNLQPNPLWGTFSVVPNQIRVLKMTLESVDKSNRTALPGNVDIIQTKNDILLPLFHGEIGKQKEVTLFEDPTIIPAEVVHATAKKRGRPRKGDIRKKPEKKSKISSTDESELIDVKDSNVEKSAATQYEFSNDLGRIDVNEDPGTVEDVIMLENPEKDTVDETNVAQASAHPNSLTNNIFEESSELTINGVPTVESDIGSLLRPSSPNIDPIRPISSKNGPSEAKKTFSFAIMKRKAQILQIIQESGGAVEGGTSLALRIDSQFPEPSGTKIDRRTVNNVINTLVREQKISKIIVTIPSLNKGLLVSKHLLVDASLPSDAPIIEEVKQRLKDGVRVRKPQPVVKNIIEENDFEVIFESPMSKRMERMRKLNSGELAPRKHMDAAARRLEKTDIERKKNKREKTKTVTNIVSEDANIKTENETEADVSVLDNISTERGEIDPLINIAGTSKRKRRSADTRKRNSETTTQNNTTVARSRKTRESYRSDVIDPDTFYRVVVIVRSLYSNVQGAINWEKVSSTFPSLSSESAKSKWPKIRDLFGGTRILLKSVHRWESIFLKNYEAENLPMVTDGEFDILSYVDFWRQHDEDEEEVSSVPDLYDSRQAIEDEYVFIPAEGIEQPMEAVYSSPSMVKNEEIMVSIAFAAECKEVSEYQNLKDSQPDTQDDFQDSENSISKAKQVIKSIIATPDSEYQAATAQEILENLGEDLCSQAIREMEQEKCLIFSPKFNDKTIPGRSFIFSEKFTSTINSRMIAENMLTDASSCLDSLIDTFDLSKGMIMAHSAPDSSMVCFLDLICFQKLELVKVNFNSRDRLNGYNSRAMDRAKLDYDVVFKSRQGQKLAPLRRPMVNPSPQVRCKFMWISMNGKIIESMWSKCTQTVLILVSSRPGITLSGVHLKLHTVFTREESRQILMWLTLNKYLRQDAYGGFWACQGWYYKV